MPVEVKQRNAKIFDHFLTVARHNKKWAEGCNDDDLEKTASDMTKDMVRDYRRQSVEEIAAHHYDYVKLRADGRWGYQRSNLLDPHMHAIWVALEAGDPSKLLKHFCVS